MDYDLEISAGIGYSPVRGFEYGENSRIQSVRTAYGSGRIRTGARRARSLRSLCATGRVRPARRAIRSSRPFLAESYGSGRIRTVGRLAPLVFQGCESFGPFSCRRLLATLVARRHENGSGRIRTEWRRARSLRSLRAPPRTRIRQTCEDRKSVV